MKAIILSILLFVIFTGVCFAQIYVPGYTRSDGVNVSPHYRSSPNDTVIDNYSFKGNINPYTGEKGHNYYRNNPSSPYYNPFYSR